MPTVALDHPYADLNEFKLRFDIPDENDDDTIRGAINAASRMIENDTHRKFYKTEAQTRYFSAVRADILFIRDCLKITEILTDVDHDGDYETTWVAGDYLPWPYNAIEDGEPFTHLETAQAQGSMLATPYVDYVLTGLNYAQYYPSRPFSTPFKLWPSTRRGIKITGDWGWEETPSLITEGCYLQAYRIYKRKDAPLGTMGDQEFGFTRIPSLDPDLKHMIQQLVLKNRRTSL